MKVVIRHIKHKTLGTIGASSSHTMRARFTPNADPDKAPPQVLIGSNSPFNDVRDALPEKRRKNAVLALEYVISASPEFFTSVSEHTWRKYLCNQVEMLKDYYGEKNVVSSVLHTDEKTPHLAVMIVPLIDGKLNSRALIGTREACSIVQDLAGEVGREFGISRGVRGSIARHSDVRNFYSNIIPSQRKIEADLKLIEDEKGKLSRRAKTIADQEAAINTERIRLRRLAEAMSPQEKAKAAKAFSDQSPQSTFEQRQAIREAGRLIRDPNPASAIPAVEFRR